MGDLSRLFAYDVKNVLDLDSLGEPKIGVLRECLLESERSGADSRVERRGEVDNTFSGQHVNSCTKYYTPRRPPSLCSRSSQSSVKPFTSRYNNVRFVHFKVW